MFAIKVEPQPYYSDPWDWSFDDRLKRLSSGQRRVAYFYEKPDYSTFRYRVYNMIQALEGSSNETSASYFRNADLEKAQSIIERTDVLVVCRSRYTSEIDQLIYSARSKGKKVFFDVDDLIFDPSYVNLVVTSIDQDISNPQVCDEWFAFIARVGATLRLCDAAIATNSYLAEKIQELSGKETKIIPNFLNREQICISDRIFQTKLESGFERKGELCIGYFSGTPTHNKDLRVATSALRQILESYSNVSLRIAGYMDLDDDLRDHRSRVKFVPFQDFINLQTVIGGTEINIVPLQDNSFTNCKSELKYFEAAVVGTATIASPTYSFAKAIDDGINGFLANAQEWFDKLRLVIESYDQLPDLLHRAHDHARQKYGWFNQCKCIERALFETPETATRPELCQYQ